MDERRFKTVFISDTKPTGETSLPRVADAYAENAGDAQPVFEGEILPPVMTKSAMLDEIYKAAEGKLLRPRASEVITLTALRR